MAECHKTGCDDLADMSSADHSNIQRCSSLESDVSIRDAAEAEPVAYPRCHPRRQHMATNLNLTDRETCYKMMRREVMASLDLEEDRFGIDPEITAKIAKVRWRVYKVGISYYGRTGEGGRRSA